MASPAQITEVAMSALGPGKRSMTVCPSCGDDVPREERRRHATRCRMLRSDVRKEADIIFDCECPRNLYPGRDCSCPDCT